ncbi:MAG: exopolysaccharide biosynthesis polyprenyl glycosylphosphotransferase, partial [Betaproteobacteria bacterium]
MAESAPVPSAGAWPPPPEGRPSRAGGNPVLVALDAALDPLVLVLSLAVLAWFWEGHIRAPLVVLGLLAFLLAYPGSGPRPAALPMLALHLLLRWVWQAGLLAAIGLATGYIAVFDQGLLLHWLWLAPSTQWAAHLLMRLGEPGLSRLQGPARPAVVVGSNAQGAMLAERIADSPYEGIGLLGVFDDRSPGRDGIVQPLAGALADLPDFVRRHRVQLIYLSLPMSSSPRILQVLDALKDTTASIYFVPDMFITDLIQARSDRVCGVTVISVCDTPFRGRTGWLKRGSDLLLASMILLLIAPLLLVIAVLVRLDSPGLVIFSQRRYDLDGQEIRVYKFRSMTVTEDGEHIAQARQGDQRVTRLGAVLRRTSLDELPQFINVLQGRMSVVGPRPHAVAHNELYRKLIKGYMVRHKVKPGITGWAQVNGQRGETDTLDKMQA